MRPLEALLFLATLFTLFVLTLPGFRTLEWAYIGLVVLLLLAGIQWRLEGVRWQMMPIYLFTGLFFLLWLLQRFGMASSIAGTSWSGWLVFGVGLFGWAISFLLALLFPVFHFPTPSGPYPIGSLTYHWTDRNRPEAFTNQADAQRELMVQVWYPAKERSSTYVAYLQNPAMLVPVAKLLHLPAFILGHLKYVTTHATQAAAMATDQPAYPVLLFLSGRGGYRQSNTFQVEELVSHGYIVAAIDQPYAAAGVVFPDGRLVAMDPRLYDPAHIGHAPFLDTVLPFLAQDVSFALDQLAVVNQHDPNRILTGRLDLQRVGIFGVSLGGIVTGQACLHESRLRACLVMDSFMPAEVVASGLRQPTMWLSRDADTMKLEGWAQEDIDETQTTMRAVYKRLGADGYLVLIPGIFHTTFTDAPLISPLGSWVGIVGPLNGQRAHRIINVYSLAFFDHYLQGRPATVLAGLVARYPEVMVETK